MFTDLVSDIVSQIEASEVRKRARDASTQIRFNYSVAYLVLDMWKAIQSIPPRDCLIHKKKAYYSRQRYSYTNVSHRTMMDAFDGLKRLNLIIDETGRKDLNTGKGILTKYWPTAPMVDMLNALDGHPAINGVHVETPEPIILRKITKTWNPETKDTIRSTEDLPYIDTDKTNLFRSNLATINDCLLRHWPDLELNTADIPKLAEDMKRSSDKAPIDFSQRTLVRIFTVGDDAATDRFTLGGRFYRAWWQNVPKNYRMLITIDGERTSEADYSQLHPQLLYHMAGKDMGNTDAYGRILDGQHRKLVKQAFNAMLQMSRFSPDGPKDDGFKAGLEKAGITWATLRDSILEAHAPVADLFFKGIGNSLQFTDSCIAEKVMLEFAQRDIPVLPVHDSFIVNRHVEGSGDLEEVMRKAYFEVTGHRIGKIDTTLLSWSRGKQPSKIKDTVFKATKYVARALSVDAEKSGWAMRQRLFKERL
ncbi:hypothetical protein I3V23_11080 [Rhodobacterales bacterium HKCCA1288]|nr:hypothetical protein I3V23_11080 [Rhodobacterales bacterium HKCCA1288]